MLGNYLSRMSTNLGYKLTQGVIQNYSMSEIFYLAGDDRGLDTVSYINKQFEELKNTEHCYKEMTELCMITNWTMWYFYESGDIDRSKEICECYEKIDGWCMDNLKGEELSYFLRVTD